MELFLSSYDYYILNDPVEIISFEKKQFNGITGLIIEIKPNINYSIMEKKVRIEKCILIPRFDKNALVSLNIFPINVHVFILQKNGVLIKDMSDVKSLYNVAWATLYDNLEDAKNFKLGLV